MNKIVKDMITQADGESFCLMRVMTIFGALACVIYAGYSIYKGVTVSFTEWAQAYATVTGGGSLSIWAKSKAEPEQ